MQSHFGASWKGYPNAAMSTDQVLQPETIDLMRSNQLSREMLLDFSWPHLVGYGLGVRTMVDPRKGKARSTIGEFGWNGAAGSYILIDPANQLSIFLATNL